MNTKQLTLTQEADITTLKHSADANSMSVYVCDKSGSTFLSTFVGGSYNSIAIFTDANTDIEVVGVGRISLVELKQVIANRKVTCEHPKVKSNYTGVVACRNSDCPFYGVGVRL
jgi:hypothetical protein